MDESRYFQMVGRGTRTAEFTSFLSYCGYVRERFSTRGVLMFGGNRLTVVGTQYSRINAVNDNEAAP
jgi:hypothetical protein